jgi:GNAT superfamily N-acetyltransferase
MNFNLLEVGNDVKLQREFLKLPVGLYATDDKWIRPLDNDIESVFDPTKNKHFAHGECIRWILKDEKGITIGRVATFIDHEKANNEEQPTGGLGFFECIENQEAAFVLFDACKNWLAQRGIEAMDGPINFGDRDAWWGLMIKGWEYEPTYKMPWTKEYYISFFENYGFKDYFQQWVSVASIRWPAVTQGIEEKAQRIFNNPEYTFKHIEKSKLSKYAQDFRQIYNEAWAKFPGVKAMSEEQANALVKTMKPILDEELVWFAYHGDRPVAFFVTIPDLNQIVKHLDGQFNWWAKIKFMLLMAKGVLNHACGLIFGVVPDFQGKGVESAIALKMRNAGRENPHFQYNMMDMNWVGDFNPKMIRFVNQLGGSWNKKYITYRYLFDRNKEFKRCPRVG